MTATTTTYADYELPGAFLADHTSRAVASRDPQKAADQAPTGAFAFTFYDVITEVIDGDCELRSLPRNRSGRYFLGGTLRSAAAIEKLDDGRDYSTLLDNMRGNGWEWVIFCPPGNVQPFRDGDAVVEPTDGAS